MHCQRRTRGTARDFSWCWRCGQSERVGEFPTTGKIRHFENKLGKSSCTIYIYHCKSNIHNIKIFFSFPFYEFGMKKYKGNILLESRNELLSFPLKKLKIGCIWNIFIYAAVSVDAFLPLSLESQKESCIRLCFLRKLA